MLSCCAKDQWHMEVNLDIFLLGASLSVSAAGKGIFIVPPGTMVVILRENKCRKSQKNTLRITRMRAVGTPADKFFILFFARISVDPVWQSHAEVDPPVSPSVAKY